MKHLAKLSWTWLVTILALLGTSGDHRLEAAESSAPPDRIGTYDSRAIAYAHFWSDEHQRKLNELSKAVKAAKAGGEEKRFRELEAALKQEQETSHRQVFSTAPVDDVLAGMKDRLTAIEREAGVAALVSKWDKPAMKKYRGARQVDITGLLLREFKLDEKQMKIVQDIQRKKPLPLDRAGELTRKGKQ
jgi:hypothetical protein